MEIVKLVSNEGKEHGPCNSNCPTCTARKTCRWNPKNFGKKYLRDPPSPYRKTCNDAAKRLKAIKPADGKKRKFFSKKLHNLPGKWLWRFLCDSPHHPCYRPGTYGGCITCIEERFPNQEILWSNKQQAYILKK
ncbi:hypothetical protein KJ735_00815 [Patescibacteria group bacterium]|nr:hypothetical protein [Patescibacteria group bacterium]